MEIPLKRGGQKSAAKCHSELQTPGRESEASVLGAKVRKGQKLMTFSLDKIRSAGYSTTTAVLLTNSEDYPDFKVVKTGNVQFGEKLYTIESSGSRSIRETPGAMVHNSVCSPWLRGRNCPCTRHTALRSLHIASR